MRYTEENFKDLINLAALSGRSNRMPTYKVYGELVDTQSLMANLEIHHENNKVLHISIPVYSKSHYEVDIIERVARVRPALFQLAMTICDNIGPKELLFPSERPVTWSVRDN